MSQKNKPESHHEDCSCHASMSRRGFLSLGAAAGTALLLPNAHAAQNINELGGTVFVNRRRASLATAINPGDQVTVAHGGHLVFTIGEDVYRLRGGSSMQLESDSNFVVSALRILTGGLLATFGKGEKTIHTRMATIGIRGTGIYIDNEPSKTYFCTCYGETELRVPGVMNQTFTAEHHNAVMLYTPQGKRPELHQMAGFEGHTDDELRTNESYVGRSVPFSV